ncbi:hypothetical protein A3K86_15640 [Photobacterium jeanii]|uniref:Uncharacterized protein n=1 Tax=Photobacterium jeanii TaxID=858640 RepID=A0A178K7Z5_9GAMM|nr:hypothetical protein [Photobacterium jeanii]OAN13095.1 hypothetical protein A3K86_15640 [Photobacterium jeanii]PST89245.1 hypothetical protein C9I91_14085 [Photobacterium jeanii]
MNKKLLAVAISGLLLAGCGGDGSNSPDPKPGPDPKPKARIDAVFLDSQAVLGVQYQCDTGDKGQTNDIGQFKVTEGAICTFDLDGFVLGSNRDAITEKASVVTAYSLKSSVSGRAFGATTASANYTANISALLNTIDVIKTDNKIDTTDVVGNTIPEEVLTASTDDAFVQAVNKVAIVVKDSNGNKVKKTVEESVKEDPSFIKKPSEAKDDLNKTYKSENVAEVIERVNTVLAGDITKVNIESELDTARQLLDATDNSNGLHQKALSAILEIAEILNEPEVANRVSIEGSSYSEMLAQAIDLSVNPKAVAKFIETSTGTTENESKLLTDLASRLVNASERLAVALPGEGYVLPYTDDQITYQDSLVVRVGALSVANALYTAASYNAGSDEFYFPVQYKLQDVDMVIERGGQRITCNDDENGYCDYENIPTTWTEEKQNISVSNTVNGWDPKSNIESAEIMTYRAEAKELLIKAKASLVQATETAKLVALEKYIEDENERNAVHKLIVNVDGHLSGKVAYIEDDDVFVNLNKFYNVNTGVDRSDVRIDVSEYYCDESDLNGAHAEFSEELSKIFGVPTCSHDANYIIHRKDEYGEYKYTNYNLIQTLSNSSDTTKEEDGSELTIWSHTFIPTVSAKFDISVTETATSNFSDVVWCGMKDGKKVSCLDNN